MSKRQPKPKICRVDFILDAAEAAGVALVGSFNEWDPLLHPMQRGADGAWKTTISLAPGVYEYKFLVDGHWQEDPRNAHTRPNPYGSVNSIVAVSATPSVARKGGRGRRP